MSFKPDITFKILYIVSWIIFVGLSIDAGGFISNTIFTLFINPNGASKFWPGLNLSGLYQFSQSHFVTLTVLMNIVAVLKAILFYLIVHIFHKKKLNLSSPFNASLGKYIFLLAYLCIGIGLFSGWANNFTLWIVKQGVSVPTIQDLKIGGADVWFFMGFTLFIFAKIFQKGIALQSENDLTV
jgi:hypothetical protein